MHARSSGDSTARIWNINSTSADYGKCTVLHHQVKEEKSKDVTTLDWNQVSQVERVRNNEGEGGMLHRHPTSSHSQHACKLCLRCAAHPTLCSKQLGEGPGWGGGVICRARSGVQCAIRADALCVVR